MAYGFEHRDGKMNQSSENYLRQPSSMSVEPSWGSAFRFSDDLEELERHQKISMQELQQQQALEQQQLEAEKRAARIQQQRAQKQASQPTYQEAPRPQRQASSSAHMNYTQNSEPEFLQPSPTSTRMTAPDMAMSRAIQHQQELSVRQANRILELEHFLARLQAENEELRRDNHTMALQIQQLLDDAMGKDIETHHKEQEQKKRYQKIWGKLHLLL